MKGNDEVAAEYQSKFRFYFVALVFTLLAASVQSAPLAEMELPSKLLEIAGWLSLLVCGLSSLSFLEYSSVIHHHFHILGTEPLGPEARQGLQEQLDEIKSNSSTKYAIAKYSFVIGLVCIIAARGLYGICS